MAKLSEIYKVGMSANDILKKDNTVKEVAGGGQSAPASFTNGRKLSDYYTVGMEAPKAKSIPTASTPSIDYNAIINEYESLPNTNIFNRLFNSDAKSAYNRKQELNPLYEQAKDAQTKDLLARYGIADADVMRQSGNSKKENDRITSLLKSKGITDKATIDAIKGYSERLLNQKVDTNVTEYTEKHPYLGGAISVPLNQASGVTGTLQTGLNYLKGDPISNTRGGLALNQSVGNMRGAGASNFETGVGKFLYNNGLSLADMLAARKVGNLPLLLGLEKAAGTINESVDQGLNPNQIVGKGALSGATTAITEKMFENKVLDATQEAVKSVLRQGGLKALGKEGFKKVLLPLLLKSTAGEGLQEGAENIADTIADYFIAGDKNQLKQSYDNYIAQGMSQEEAISKVAIDKAKELGQDIAGGALSGLLMGGAEMGSSALDYNINNRNNANTPNANVQTEVPAVANNEAVENPAVGENTPTQIQQPVTPEAITNQNVNPSEITQPITNQNVNKAPEYNEKFPEPEKLVFAATGELVSPEYSTALRKLESGVMISPEEYENIPEVKSARENLEKEFGDRQSWDDQTPERENYRKDVTQKMLDQYGSAVLDGEGKTRYNGDVRRDKRVDLVFGLSGSGKSSTLVDPLSYKYKSRLIDSDEVKKVLKKDLKNDRADGYVHEESSNIAGRALAQAIINGDNIVYPKVGDKFDKMMRLIKNFKDEGYSVYIHFNDLNPAKAAGRNLRRYATATRFVDLVATSFNYGNRPAETFERLVKEGGVDGYSKLSNDVAINEPPIQLEGTEDISSLIRNYRESRGTGTGDTGVGTGKVESGTRLEENSNNTQPEVNQPNNQRDQVMAEDIGLNERSDEFYDRGQATLTENPNGGIPNIQRRNEYTSRAATNSFNNSGIFRQSEEYFNHMIDRATNEELQVELKSMKKTNENTVEKLDEKGVDGVYKELMKKGVNSAEDVCASCYLMDYFIKNGDTVRADLLSRKVIDSIHNTGQTLQFMSAYSNTPAGMLQAMNALTGRETKIFIKEAKKSKLNNKKAEQFKQNGRLAAALKRIGYDGSMGEEKAKTFQDILQEVKNTMSLESSSIQDDFTDADIEYLARLIEGGADVEELTNALTQHLVTGYFTISQEDIQRINELYNLADNANTSKERFEYQKQAAAIAAKYLGNASFMDKWNSWRYLAMLGNPRTMIRNVLGNKAFGAVTDIKDNVAAVLESMIIKDKDGRTKALLSKTKDADLLKAAENDFEKYAYEHVAGSSKWTMKNTIENERQIFKNKALEWARTKTSDKLESDDLKAIKRKYKRALAGFLKANGANASEFNSNSELLQKARDYAIQEAKIATFHEDNSLADILNRASNSMRERGDFVGKAAEVAIESTIPFKKTPLNILKQGVVEYSPISALRAVKDIATKQDANVWINDLSKGLTGSAILGIGWLLGQKGMLVGQRDDDEEDLYNKGSNYSLKVNGKSFTLDWLAPAALPLFVGSELAKEFEGDSDKNLLEILASIAEPAVEMSMLQGLDNLLSSLSNTEGTKLAPTVSNVAAGYVSQAVPTLFGQVARTIDPYRRSTRTNDSAYKNAAMATVEKTGEKIMNKIPGLSMLNQKYVDVWGEPQKNADGVPFTGGNVIGRAFQNFISPGYFNDLSMNEREEKLAELEKTYKKNGYEGTLIPSVASSNKPDETRMTNDEYESWATTRGKELSKAVDTALKYKKQTTVPELQKYVKKIENFANFVAQNKEFDKTVTDTYKKAYEAYKLGGYDGVMTYYMMDDQSDLDGNGSVTHEELAEWLRKSNVPVSKRLEYFKIKFPKAKKIPSLK